MGDLEKKIAIRHLMTSKEKKVIRAEILGAFHNDAAAIWLLNNDQKLKKNQKRRK